MSTEIIYILTACAMMGTLYAFTLINLSQKKNPVQAKRKQIDAAARPEPPVSYVITLKLEEIFKRFDSLEMKDVNSLRDAVAAIKQDISAFGAEVALKLGSDEQTKSILQSSLARIGKKADEVLKRFESEQYKLESEKTAAEKELGKLKDEFNARENENKLVINKLSAHLESIKAGVTGVNIEELKKEIEPILAEAAEITKKYAAGKAGQNETLSEKDSFIKSFSAAAVKAADSAEKEKTRRIFEMRSRLESLAENVKALRRAVLTEQEKQRVETEKAANGAAQIKEYIAQLEQDKITAEKLIFEREALREKLGELKAGLKIQEENFAEELAARDAEIESITAQSRLKIKEIEDSAAEDELKFGAERKALEEEAGRLRQQLHSNTEAGGQKLEKLKSELNSLEEARRKKELEYSEFNRERIEKEKSIKDELNGRIDEFRKAVESNIKKFAKGSKKRDDEIYNLKVRLSAREDKLKTDLEKRRESGKLLLEDLRRTSDALRKSHTSSSEAISVRVKPMLERIESVRKTLATLENMIGQEQTISARLESERCRIGEEIESIQGRIEQDKADAKRLIELKDRYVARLSEEIIEKERLFEVERKARQQIIQGRYLVKHG